MAKSKNTGLGRGLDSLIPSSLDVTEVASPGESVRKIAIDKLITNPDQPRKSFDQKMLKELADSIKQHGIIQPIVVTPHTKQGTYRIVAGERRYRASILAGVEKLPAIIRDHKALEELEIALVENVQRVDLSPLEQAVSIVRLHDQFSMSFKDIATKLGKAETTISNMIRLLQLPPEAVKAMQQNQITEGHARAILALKTDEKAQKELLNTIIIQKLSVRAAEDFVHQKKQASDAAKKPLNTYNQQINKLINALPKAVARRTNIKQKANGKGTVQVTYDNEKQLEHILNSMSKL